MLLVSQHPIVARNPTPLHRAPHPAASALDFVTSPAYLSEVRRALPPARDPVWTFEVVSRPGTFLCLDNDPNRIGFKAQPCFGNERFVVRKTAPGTTATTFVVASVRFPDYFVCVDADGTGRVMTNRAAAVVDLIKGDDGCFTILQNGVALKLADCSTGRFHLRQVGRL